MTGVQTCALPICIFGAAVAGAKIFRLNEDQMNSTIALCASLASGNVEGARSGGRALREGAAVRNAMLAVALARQGHVGGETVLEGDAGFYHAYVGNNLGRLTLSFVGDTRASLDNITADLGKNWIFLETLYRIYSISGYNIAHIDVAAAICKENNIQYKDVDRVECVSNWLETQYPSPAFPSRREDGKGVKPGETKVGCTAYYVAYGVVKGRYPVTAGRKVSEADAPAEVKELMQRVRIIPSADMTLFGPRVTIFTKDGKSYTKQSTGREFIWDYDGLVARLADVVPTLPIPAAQYQNIIDTCRDLEKKDRADALVKLTIKK